MLFQRIRILIVWICRCWLSFSPPQSLISNEVRIYLWWYDNIMEIIKQIMETCELPSIRGNATKLIILHALHRLKNDTLRVIELSIYHPSLLLSLTPEEWWNCYSTSTIKWQFSRSIHKGIVNCNAQEAHWNTSTQRSPCYSTKEKIIMSTWGRANW